MDEDEPLPTVNPDILVSRATALDDSKLNSKLRHLNGCLNGSNDEIKVALREAVPTYTPGLRN